MRKYFYLFIFLSVYNGFSQSFSGNGGVITDNGQVIDFPINVSNLSENTLSTSFGLTEVCLNITHTWDSDLNVSLVSPSGVSVNLFSGIGGSDDNFSNTCLNQSATNSINNASAPFEGVFKPQESLGNQNNGQTGNGIWKLRIQDTYPQDEGVLINWQITFGANAAAPFVFTTSNLPIVIIDTNNQTIVDEPSIIANMKIIDNGFGNINSVSDLANDYDGKIKIEFRGNYSQSLPQKPYKIETIDQEDLELNVSLLGMPAEHDWALLANYNDKVFMRNQLAYNLFSQMGHYAARTKHCEVIVNGTYQGVFILSETIKRDNNRVDIAKLNPDENTGLDLTGGYIIKNDYWDFSTGWQLNNSPIDHPGLVVGLAYHYPKDDNISSQQKDYIADYINQFENALYSNDFANENTGYQKYIDVDSFIDYFIINELSRNNDGFKKSSYFHKDKDSNSSVAKLYAGPVWDFDWAWKNINECSFLAVTDGSGWSHWVNDCNPDVNSPGWYIRLLQDENFRNKLRCRWETVRQNILSTNAIFEYIDTTATYINDAQMRHFEKWGNLGIPTGAPEVDGDPNTFNGQIAKFKNWITTRVNWLDANMPGNSSDCILGISNQEKTALKIFPNPTSDYFMIAISDISIIKEVKITNMTGKLMLRKNNLNSNEKIYTDNLPNGLYIISIETENNKIHTEKLSIIK